MKTSASAYSAYLNEAGSLAFQFYNCQCIGTNLTAPETTNTATIGYCELECSNFWVYMILFSVFVFIHSTSEVGSMLLILRCVDPRDKAMALGLIQFAIGLFGNYKPSIPTLVFLNDELNEILILIIISLDRFGNPKEVSSLDDL